MMELLAGLVAEKEVEHIITMGGTPAVFIKNWFETEENRKRHLNVMKKL